MQKRFSNSSKYILHSVIYSKDQTRTRFSSQKCYKSITIKTPPICSKGIARTECFLVAGSGGSEPNQMYVPNHETPCQFFHCHHISSCCTLLRSPFLHAPSPHLSIKQTPEVHESPSTQQQDHPRASTAAAASPAPPSTFSNHPTRACSAIFLRFQRHQSARLW